LKKHKVFFSEVFVNLKYEILNESLKIWEFFYQDI